MNENWAIVKSLDGMNGVVLEQSFVLNGSDEQVSGIAKTFVKAFELMRLPRPSSSFIINSSAEPRRGRSLDLFLRVAYSQMLPFVCNQV
jgi:hypothetical protein